MKKLEKTIGYIFKNPGLLELALTHSSHSNERGKGRLGCNERLEFLGDSILGYFTAEYLFGAYPDKPDTDYYGVIRNSAASGCRRAFLIEHGFHTNPEDSAFLRDKDALLRLALAEADVIDRFF